MKLQLATAAFFALATFFPAAAAQTQKIGAPPEAGSMLVGDNDLQGRSGVECARIRPPTP